MPMPIPPFAAPALFTLMQVMGGMYTDYTAAPPTTGYSWERSSAGPETTDVSQFSVLVGFAFSPLQIEQFFAAANSIYAVHKEFTTMIAFFPYFWKICGFGFRRVVEFVFLKFCGQSGLKLRAIEFFLKKKECFQKLFKAILYLLWT